MISWIISVLITAGIFLGSCLLAKTGKMWIIPIIVLIVLMYNYILIPIHLWVVRCLR